MGNEKSCTPELRGIIVNMIRHQKKSMGAIAKTLLCSKCSFFNAIHHVEDTGSLENRKRSSRPRKTTLKRDLIIHRISQKSPFETSVTIRKHVQEKYEIHISGRTIQRRLTELGLNGRIARRKPLVSANNIARQIAFSKHQLFNSLSKWKNVIWSDESRFKIFWSDRKCYVCRPVNSDLDPKFTLKSVKHGGGSLMVWACFSWYGVGPIMRINGIMDKFVYREILKNVLEPYIFENMPITCVFQHDNDPKHTKKHLQEYLKSTETTVFDWPPQSPDWKQIENLWLDVKKELRFKNPQYCNQLFEFINEIWQNITPLRYQRRLDSMQKSC